MQQEAPPNKVLGVWGLSSRSREEDVRDMFTKVIEVEQVSLITDRRVSLVLPSPLVYISLIYNPYYMQTGESKCYAFIN